ncbi:hypothetical protein NPIL_325281 [Nephila pilipes]|uniref:Uncharacterized protein n=1 Tax=Nephila pilipes TaxID=299642 RepID=A0A8X6T438_NEPPI|nr:hypothetical protein NPIL_325281 [Nephila pilipes]
MVLAKDLDPAALSTYGVRAPKHINLEIRSFRECPLTLKRGRPFIITHLRGSLNNWTYFFPWDTLFRRPLNLWKRYHKKKRQAELLRNFCRNISGAVNPIE